MTPVAPALPLWLIAGGSAGALVAALFFQHVVGLAPCGLCYLQRYGLGAVLCLAALALVLRWTLVAWAGAAAAATSTGFALYHTGVERMWWPGPASCSAASEDLGGLSGADLLAVDSAPALVRCDEIVWQFLGLSMANYNVALSAGCLALFVWAALRR